MISLPTADDERENQPVFPFSYTSPSGGNGVGRPIPLFEDETVEDLQRDGLRLIQQKGGFRFGEDSVLLAHHAAATVRRPVGLRVADLGCGCGFMTVLLCSLLPHAVVTGLELLPVAARTACRNLALNCLESRAHILEGDLRVAASDGSHQRGFDLAVCNPPYREPERGIPPADPGRAAALQSGSLSMDDLALAAFRLLRPRGTLVMTQRPGRLPDVLCTLRGRGLEPKSLREVLPMAGRPASLLLVTAVKGAKPGGFLLLPPLTVRNADGRYTDEVQAFYQEESIEASHLMDGLTLVAGCNATDEYPGGKP